MSTTTELAELHHLIGSLRRCVTSLQSKYGDSPHTRRIVNDRVCSTCEANLVSSRWV